MNSIGYISKLITTAYIALGFVLSMAIGFEYNCEGTEMFPIYYGAPFVYKQESLASSMEYFYSIFGLVLNVVTWSIFLVGIRYILIKVTINKTLKKIYRLVVIILIAKTTFFLFINTIMLGSGFSKNSNYWYFDLDKEAKEWGMICDGKFVFYID